MKCPGCGNVLTQEEAFCGQCGTSTTIVPMGQQPANTMIGTPSPHTGLLGATPYTPPSFNNSLNNHNSRALTPEQAAYTNMAPAPTTSFGPPSAPLPPANVHMQTGFYHEATDFMAPVQPNANPSLVLGYPQQSFSATGMPTSYSGMAPGTFAPQANPSTYAFQTGNYAGPMPTQYPPEIAQGYHNYGAPGRPPQVPQKQSSHLVILVVCITLAVILVGAMGVTAFALTNRSSSSKQANTQAVPTTVPTVAPTPTLMPSPTSVPSPTPLATQPPDAGFSWCGVSCSQYGFATEFPTGWAGAPPASSPGFQFSDPAQPSVYAAFKTPGAATTTANVIIMSEVQTTFGSQPGYVAPAPPTSAPATIGGAAWYAVVTTYNDAQNQPIYAEVYATVYQGKTYIIELQAPNAQFGTIKQQSFVNMLVKFQFVSSAQ